jgi:hypothetical protein
VGFGYASPIRKVREHGDVPDAEHPWDGVQPLRAVVTSIVSSPVPWSVFFVKIANMSGLNSTLGWVEVDRLIAEMVTRVDAVRPATSVMFHGWMPGVALGGPDSAQVDQALLGALSRPVTVLSANLTQLVTFRSKSSVVLPGGDEEVLESLVAASTFRP